MRVELQVENGADQVRVEHGELEQGDVRRATVEATADTSATLLTLPQELVRALGLRERADGSVPQWPWPGTLAGPVTVRIGARHTTLDCVVGPPRSRPLVGSTVLRLMDLVADEATGTVRPRGPERWRIG